MAIFGFGKKKPADVVPMPGADGVQPEQFQGNVAFDKPVTAKIQKRQGKFGEAYHRERAMV